ncbi:Metallocarboxypeptidase inhibitor [Melia azedarach]|nr:Metallocarboxypeptidase inhibitor [Melia azedarach]
MKIDGECLIELIGSCRNKVQVYRSVRMPQLHTSLHFHLTPIVMINGSSRRDLLLNSQNFCRSIPAGAENPSLSRLCYRRLWGSRNRRALILGWAYYLDAFSSYPLRTWLPSVYRGHDNWYTRGASFPGPLVLGKGPLNALTPTPDIGPNCLTDVLKPSSRTALMGEQPNPWNILQPQVAKSRHRGAKPSRRCELLGKISLLSLE